MAKVVGAWIVVLAIVGGCAGADDDVDTDAIAKNDKPTKCKQHKRKNKTHGDCTAVTSTVGLQGGTVTMPAGGPALTIPFGALPANTTITITTTDDAPPSGIGAVGPVFEFEPDGLVFAKPVTVSLPMPAGVTSGQVYWSQLEGPGFDAIGGTIANGRISTQTVHFSLAVVGSPLGPQTLQGSSIDYWISASGVHEEGTALANQAPSAECDMHGLEAIVSDGMGGFVRRCGDFTSDKKAFTVPNVPLGGDYMLHTLSADNVHTLLVASTELPDLGRHLGGRPFPTSTDPLVAARTALTGVSYLDLEVTNLGGWQDAYDATGSDIGDQIEVIASEADAWWFAAETTNPPVAGAGTGSVQLNLPFEKDQYPFAQSLIEGSQGDRTFAAKLERRLSGGGFYYQAMSAVGEVPTFDLVQNGSVSRSVALTPISSTANTLSLVFDGAAHVNALQAYGNPQGLTQCPLCGGFIGMLAQGNDAKFGFYTANADLLLLYDLAAQGTVMATGAMQYAPASSLQRPCGGQSATGCVPGTWGELAVARWTMFRQVVLPDSSGPSGGAGLAESIEWVTKRDQMTGTVAPKLTQVTNVRVNGTLGFDGAPSVGTTTELTWDLPAVGTPLFYSIRVRRLFVRPNNRTGGELVAQVYTPDRSFRFPPGILDASETYAFIVSAYASTGDAAAAAALVGSPFKAGLEIASSDVSTGVFGSARGTPPLPEPITVHSGMSFPTGAAASSNAIYWTDRYDSFWNDPWTDSGLGTIWRADRNGDNPSPIATGQHAPNSIAATDTHVYWINNGLGPDATLMALELGQPGPPSELVAMNGLGSVTVTPDGRLVYCGGGGTFLYPDPVPLSPWCGHLAADNTNAYITVYGTGPGNTGKLVQVALDGMSAEIDLVTDQPQTWDVETDGTNVYWTNQAWQQSFDASVNSVGVGQHAQTTLFEGNEVLKVFAIDGGYAYFVVESQLRRVALDGSSGGVAEPVAELPSACPQGDMAAFDGHIVWTDVCLGAAYLVIP